MTTSTVTTISSVVLDVDDVAAAEAFYSAHRIVVLGDGEAFTDPDGFGWESRG